MYRADMSIDAATLIGGALGGAVAQSVFTPLFGQRHERRDLRAGVIRSLAELQRTRWAPHSKSKFRHAVTDLRTAALVAGGNRALIEEYISLACAGRTLSERSFDENPDPEFGGGIDIGMADLISEAAAAVMDFTWHPWLRRPTRRIVLAGLARRKAAVARELEEDGTHLDWDSVWIPS
jgi:hypothetical protein